METILITGATGNVGLEVIQHLVSKKGDFKVICGVRDAKSENNFFQQSKLETINFDFGDKKSISKAFEQSDVLFLLRPPQLANVKRYFKPLIELAKEKSINHIVFLSVQGVETNSMIPHYKIEKLIVQSGINYTFLRPAYFMQNFTTTLRKDLIEKNRIYLPSGKAKFTLIDVEDVGAVAADVLTNKQPHINQAYDLTNEEQLSFGEMAEILSEVLRRKIRHDSPDLFSFYLTKSREKIPTMFILVMTMLHYLPRFKSTPPLSGWVQKITGKRPRNFREFVEKNQDVLSVL